MTRPAFLSRLLTDYGMALVLVLLCIYYSVVTVQQQHPTGATAARQLAKQITTDFTRGSRIVIVARDTRDDIVFADSLSNRLTSAGLTVHMIKGGPAEARAVLQALSSSNATVSAVACAPVPRTWTLFDDATNRFSALASARILVPTPYRWPNFLKRENLLNIVNQIAVIAIVAVGMTLVIITGGIDLSVGSLIALSAVIATLLIRDFAGAEQSSSFGMFLCCAIAILICAFIGFISGFLVAIVSIPSFIATLGMMLVGSGLAFIIAAGQSIYQVPDSFVWLGRGAEFGIPNSVILMVVLYAATHVLMTSTRLGRYIYAVGGNSEAARLSGVSVKSIGLFVYSFSGALAGLGGIVTASQLKSGSPTYGGMYELYVIAAVVVGGTSLVGGEGKVLGTLIGAFIIAVIQNGMNLTGVESYTQKVVLGLVILGAVMVDMLKRHGGQWFQAYRRRALARANKTP